MKRQNWTEAEQRLMILEILKGTKSAGQVAKERGVSDSLVYRWRDKALKAISDTFSDKRKQKRQDNSTAERDRLLKIIGEQACVIDTLKKTSEMFSR
ncbi:MAG: transposase [Calditrichaeota bacterium]|nr:transposase [Calditrichota bacterium]